MRIGRPVWFEAKGSIRIGQVIGICSGEKTVGEVQESDTGDGLTVKVNTAGDTFWVKRGDAHRVHGRLEQSTAQLLGVPLGMNAQGEMLQEP